jgi:hypothetical protein
LKRGKDYSAEYEARNPGAGKKRARKSKYKHCHNYQYYIDIWDTLTKCDICFKEFVSSQDKCMDHYENTIRGVLCKKCNTALGSLGDTPEGLNKEIAYMKRSLAHDEKPD